MVVLGQAESRTCLNDAVFLVLIDDGDLTENGIAFVDVVNTVDGLRLADRISLLAVLLADHIAFIETCAVYTVTVFVFTDSAPFLSTTGQRTLISEGILVVSLS